MAIFKLSAFVTAIVGSVGGTNFKRGANNAIVSNKSFGGSKSTLRKNPWLNQISDIFKQWARLAPTVRNDWNYVATLYTFPDKFGVLRNLTGRQLYSKLSIQLLPVSAIIPGPGLINNTLGIVTLDSFDLTIFPFLAELTVNVSGDDTYLLVQIEVKKKTLLAPVFSRRRVSAFMFGSSAIGFDITAQILQQFPFIDNTYNIRAFVSVMNESGFKSVSKYIDGDWIA